MKFIFWRDFEVMYDDVYRDFLLVNVLFKDIFNWFYIWIFVNVLVDNVFFEIMMEYVVGSKYCEIVFYCVSFNCLVFIEVVEKLEKVGFISVYDYEGGI